jgi:hypothetical protein
MGKGVSRCLLMAVFGLILLPRVPAQAQSQGKEKPVMYTYVLDWIVPRGMWADYQKTRSAIVEVLATASTNGTITSYGVYETIVHQENESTHGAWFTAGSMANLLKTLEELRANPSATSPVIAASKHWDSLLASRDYNGRSGTFSNGYIRVGTWHAKAGASDPGGVILKSTMVAMLEKLVADGSLYSYQVDEEAVHTTDPDAFWVAVVANGGAGLDKYLESLEQENKKNPAAMAGFTSMIDYSKHRDYLARVTTMVRK